MEDHYIIFTIKFPMGKVHPKGKLLFEESNNITVILKKINKLLVVHKETTIRQIHANHCFFSFMG